MKMIVFNQWEALVKRFRSIAAETSESSARRTFAAVETSGGHVHLTDLAVNGLSLENETVTVHVPEIVPGKARNFVLRVKAAGTCALSFTGCESFEGEADALSAPADGETAVYSFTETEPDVLFVTRVIAAEIAG